MAKYISMREIKKTKRTEAIKSRFVSGPEDITDIKLENGKGRRTPQQRKNISEGMAKARLKGKVLGRPSWIEGSLKRSVKVRILKEDLMGIKHSRIIKNLDEDGISISKASFSRLIRKLKRDL